MIFVGLTEGEGTLKSCQTNLCKDDHMANTKYKCINLPPLHDDVESTSRMNLFVGGDDMGWPLDTSSSRPPSPQRGTMSRAQAKSIHDKVNSLLYMLEIDPSVNSLLPHSSDVCAIRYEPHGASTKDEGHKEEAWKCHKKEAVTGVKPE
jgi:hypothetical protein